MMKKFKSLSSVLKQRLMATLVIGIVLLSAAIGLSQYQNSIETLEKRAQTTLIVTSKSMNEPLWNINKETIKEFADAVLLDSDVTFYEVMDDKNESIYRTSDAASTEKSYATICSSPEAICASENVMREGNVIGSVRIAFSLGRIHRDVFKTLGLVAGFGLGVIVVLTALISRIVTKLVTEPLSKLSAGANQMAAGNLNYDFNLRANNEIGQLASNFTAMRDSIRSRIDDLATLNLMGEKIASIKDDKELLQFFAQVTGDKLKASSVTGYVYDGKDSFHLATSPSPALATVLSNEQGQLADILKCQHLEFVEGSALGSLAPRLAALPLVDQGGEPYGLIVATMNPTESISESSRNFVETLNRTAVIRLANINMVAVIEAHNRNLELLVAARTKDLARKTSDMNSMLSNVKLGIFTLMPERKIHPEYSKYLEEIYDTKVIADQDAMTMVFLHSNVEEDIKNQVSNAIDMIMGEHSWNFEANSQLFVREITLATPSGKPKEIELEWNPIIDDDGMIERMLVTARDVTEINQLRARAAQKSQEMEMIYQILNIGPEKFGRLAEFTARTLKSSANIISSVSKRDMETINKLFRNLHTIKGAARTLGLTSLTNSVHLAEHKYSTLRIDETLGWNQLELLSDLKFVQADLDRYQNIYDLTLGKFAGSGYHSADLDAMLLELKDSLADLAAKIHKPAPHFNCHIDPEVKMTEAQIFDLKLAMVHMLTNSMDHGIENPELRKVKGKSRIGTINITFISQGSHAILEVSDDGAGLDIESLRKNLESKGKPTADLNIYDIACTIFLPNVSTAASVSDISGRGVGLDAVRETVGDMGGKIELVLNNPNSRDRFVPFKFVIHLPLNSKVHTA